MLTGNGKMLFTKLERTVDVKLGCFHFQFDCIMIQEGRYQVFDYLLTQYDT